jgi:hypothetical protein
MRHRHTDGAGPNKGVVHDEAGHEILIFAGRYPVLQARADHLVAGPFPPVPGAVLGRKRIPAVLRGELVAIVDDHSHRGRMRLDQHVGDSDSPYRSGRSPDWLKMKNADAPAVKREEEEEWGKKKRR